MSLASEYAALVKMSPRPFEARLGKAYVDSEGKFWAPSAMSLSPDEALAMAHRILATFGEKEGEG
jgi:hypothetical protein